MRQVIAETGKTTPSFVVTQEERIARLHALDLTNVKRKLMEAYPEGKGWTEEQVLEAEKWYKRFLEVILRDDGDEKQRVPNHVIDSFWHCHILDTKAYAADCQRVFGYFLHHYQYFGMNGDASKRDDKHKATSARYHELFGEDCSASADMFGRKDDRVVSHDGTPLGDHRPYANVAAMCTGNGDGCSSCRRTS